MGAVGRAGGITSVGRNGGGVANGREVTDPGQVPQPRLHPVSPPPLHSLHFVFLHFLWIIMSLNVKRRRKKKKNQ